ncbi:MAG: ImmA/IrrE family metallo-endopeptidase [candidate division NC10 bacterium]|nr:ImmA/IrrE family metallo-endopeptidase [candidate division NC10 bacterium]
MSTPPIPRYALTKLESLACDLLRERWPGLTIPVDIELLTEREPGVTLDTERGLQAQFGVPGVTVYHPKEDRFTVLIDEAVADGNPGFYRFTVGEELGHLHLHRPVLRHVHSVEEAAMLHASSDYEYLDRNAKWFASALLMPSTPLLQDARQVYAGLVKQYGFDRLAVFRRSLVIRLSQRYVVNVGPMQYRLERWPVEVLRKVDRALDAKALSLAD